jgi:hypothetical protein
MNVLHNTDGWMASTSNCLIVKHLDTLKSTLTSAKDWIEK